MTTIAVVTRDQVQMLVEWRPINTVKPYPNNPRVLRNAAEKVAESIGSFGWRQPIVVDESGVIIAGHSRLAAAKLLKLKQVPVHVAADLSADQVRALRIADNKTATFADWDEGKLADELAEIMGSLGNVAVTGFSQSEFDAIEMRARAEIDRISRNAAAGIAPVSHPETDADEKPAPQQGAASNAERSEDGEDADADAGDPITIAPDMVPLNVLMTVDARQVVYDAIARAKQAHSLKTTADALHAICKDYANA